MTSDTSVDEKIVIFLPDGVEDEYKRLPADVKRKADQVTTALQNKQRSSKAKPLTGSLSGVTEFFMDYDTNTFRVYYAVEFEYCLYIIDAGMKKSKKGGEIPNEQVRTLVSRKRDAVTHYHQNEAMFKKRHEKRKVDGAKKSDAEVDLNQRTGTKPP